MNKTTPEQAKDTAILCGLFFEFAFLITGNSFLIWPSTLILIVALLNPLIFRPIAKVWFGLSRFIGSVMTVLILSAIFLLIVTPIGMIRRMIGCDPMQIRPKNSCRSSAFTVRNYKYVPHDLERPF